jgi:hypothetical protein
MSFIEKKLEALERRVAIIEHALGVDLEIAEQLIVEDRAAQCVKGNHKWERIAYDLQGGKWGKDRCIYCNFTSEWSV